MKSSLSKYLSIFLAVIIVLVQFPLSTSADTTNGEAVQVTKTVNPTEILAGGEAEVKLDIKGTGDVNFVKPNDIILIIDRSGSMGPNQNNGEDKMSNAKAAAKGFIDLVDFTKHRVGIVDFSDEAKYKDLSTNPTDLKNYINGIRSNGGTGTQSAIQKAEDLLSKHRTNAQPVIVLMTDGEATVPDPPEYARQMALEQANQAKSEGVVFYTIALLKTNEDPNTSAPNELLKAMATTAHHHHFVLGSIGLAEIYKAIVDEIGVASAYDVTVTDTVAPEFEIVPGSYEDNIPQPTVNGNTLTWKFNELKNEDLTLNYKIRHKTGARVGELSVGGADINVNYKDHLGTAHEFSVTHPTIKVTNPAPEITSIVADHGLVDGGETVVITGKNFLPNSTVSFGDNEAASVQYVDSTKLIVTTPKGTQGTVTVKVTNPDGQFATTNYNYIANPVVTSITPNSGPLAGGTRVQIKGNYFLSGAQVQFGDQSATIVSVEPTQITVDTPASAKAQPVDVRITNPDGTTVTVTNGFTYFDQPEITSIVEDHGLVDGGETVVITGKNFLPDLTVLFGDNAATSVQYVDSTKLIVTTPKGTQGDVIVKVTNPDGQFATGNYKYIANPVVSSITPNSGPLAGGTRVQITGNYFLPGAQVQFGDQSATIVSVEPTQITVDTPASAKAQPVDVKITNPDSTTVTVTNGFTYLGQPELLSVTPNKGPVKGGDAVTLNGNQFMAGAKVYFNNTLVPATFVSSNEITLTTPSWSKAESVKVRVVNPDGQETTLDNGYQYVNPKPVILSITPNQGEVSGNLQVDIKGENFTNGAIVYFDGVKLSNVVFYSSTQLRIRTPQWQTAETVDVKVVNPDGQEDIITDGFTYNLPSAAQLTGLSPAQGPVAGGTKVKLAGTNLGIVTELYLDSVKVTIQSNNETEITFTTPKANTPGKVDVKVVDKYGRESILPLAFEYLAPPPPPEITSIVKDQGLIDGGETVVITGNNFLSNSTVQFGSNAAASVQYVDSSKLIVTTPKGSVGSVVVKVTNPDGQFATTNYKYIANPIVNLIQPNMGPLAGGTRVTITGNYFLTGALVQFGDQSGTVVSVQPNEITVDTPASALAQSVDVKVTNPDGTTVTVTNGFTYAEAPELLSVTPDKGLVKGGDAVTLSGNHFAAGAKVYFNTTLVTATVVSGTEITLITPSWSTDQAVKVKVVNPDGQEASLDSGYQYVYPKPIIVSITPNQSEVTGGAQLDIKGENFVSGAQVFFDGVKLSNVVFYSSTQLKTSAPQWPTADTVDVKVVNPDSQEDTKTDGFTYILPASPQITSLNPVEGPLDGGTQVKIVGTNLTNVTELYVGSIKVNILSNTGTEISFSTPKATVPGKVDVRVVDKFGRESSLQLAFEYLAPPPPPDPTIVSVTPNEGAMEGGYYVVIKGTNFDSTSSVYVNNVSATTVYYSSTEVRAKIPASSVSGTFDVKVVNGNGKEVVASNAFTYLAPPPKPAPIITEVTPNEGLMQGGYIVKVLGTNFDSKAKVYFDGTSVPTVFYSSTELRITAPASQTAGTVDVKVGNPDGQEFTLPDAFTYLTPPKAPSPTITSISPNEGFLAGGYNIIVKGTNFTNTSKIQLDDVTLQTVFYSATELRGKVPASTEEKTVDVKVINPDGEVAIEPDSFTYIAPPPPPGPKITSLSQNSGNINGGYNIFVNGENFDSSSKVYFNDVKVPSIFYSAGQIRVTVPATTVTGTVNVKVVNGDGQQDIMANGFTYILPPPPTITSITPNTGEMTGGYYISIKGANFDATDVVYINHVAVQTVFYSATEVRGMVPKATKPGPVDVQVINSNNQEAIANSGFSYNEPPIIPAPDITSITPNTGQMTGGYFIIIKGTNFNSNAKILINNVEVQTVFYSSTEVRGRVPATSVIGSVDVKVVNPDAQYDVVPGGFTYEAPPKKPEPTITSITPNTGSLTGGSLIIIKGTNYESTSVVYINNVSVQTIFYSAGELRARVPASSTAGPVDVKVLNSDGQTVIVPGGYTYQ